jgi:AraC-like DNA-binding protein
MSNIIHIKIMVCPRCIVAVEEAIAEVGHTAIKVELGKAEIKERVIDLDEMQAVLEKYGFELLTKKERMVSNEVRTALLKAVSEPEIMQEHFKVSTYLADELNQSYHLISRSFSQTEDQTIEKFFIKLKIEKAKELICYDELNSKEIAARLGYSSVQHFYAQFKQITGISAKEFKEGGTRKSLTDL